MVVNDAKALPVYLGSRKPMYVALPPPASSAVHYVTYTVHSTLVYGVAVVETRWSTRDTPLEYYTCTHDNNGVIMAGYTNSTLIPAPPKGAVCMPLRQLVPEHSVRTASSNRSHI